MVVVALAEPAVVHHEQLDADAGGLIGKLLLAGFVDVESGGFPGIVEHRARVGRGVVGQDFVALESMQYAGAFAEAAIGEAAVEGRRFQAFAGLEEVAEIEIVQAAGDAALLGGRFLDDQFPIAAPADGTEPYASVLFVRGALVVEREPWIGLMAGVAAAAFHHLLAGEDGLAMQLRLTCPAAGEIAKPVALAGGHVPDAGLRALDHHGLAGGVADDGALLEDSRARKNAVKQIDLEGVADVLSVYCENVAADFLRDVTQQE